MKMIDKKYLFLCALSLSGCVRYYEKKTQISVPPSPYLNAAAPLIAKCDNPERSRVSLILRERASSVSGLNEELYGFDVDIVVECISGKGWAVFTSSNLAGGTNANSLHKEVEE